MFGMTYALAIPNALAHWADPRTWPWFVWAWIAFALIGWIRPAWRWLQGQRASGWPTVIGRVESAIVNTKKHFGFGTTTRGDAAEFSADLFYSYTVDGQRYAGSYKQYFETPEQGLEFVWKLQGMAVVVSFNPKKPSKSNLTEDSISALLSSRPPVPEGMFLARVGDPPGWSKPLLWPCVVLSALGLGLSLWVHLGALAGRRVAPDGFFWGLHVGIFVVWFPAFYVAKERFGNTARKGFWKVALKGSPEWLRYLVYGFLIYAVVNFALFMLRAPQGHFDHVPAAVWQGFSGHWMAFYSCALAILYSAAVAKGDSNAQKPPHKIA